LVEIRKSSVGEDFVVVVVHEFEFRKPFDFFQSLSTPTRKMNPTTIDARQRMALE
jgi:hypothetical protein